MEASRGANRLGSMRHLSFSLMVLVLVAACGHSEPAPAVPASAPVPAPSAVGPKRPTTSQELANAVFTALKAGDQQALIDLIVTVDDVSRACPALTKKFVAEREKIVAASRDHFVECQSMIDWSQATISGFKGGEVREASEKCAGAQLLRDVHIFVRSGPKLLEMKLDEPLALAGVVVLGDDNPRCKYTETVE